MEKGDNPHRSIKGEQDEEVQGAADISGPPPGFSPLAPRRTPQKTSDRNTHETSTRRRIPSKEHSRRYRQKKKAEREGLYRKRDALQNERQSLLAEIVQLENRLFKFVDQMEKGARLKKSVKREQDEGVQAADSVISCPPPGFGPLPAPQRIFEGMSEQNTQLQETTTSRRTSRKEYSRKYRLKKKGELEGLKREIDALENERESLRAKKFQLQATLNNKRIKLESP